MAFGRGPSSFQTSMDNVVLKFLDADGPRPNLGDGISRARADDVTKPFKLLVRFSNAAPMTATINAVSGREALKYARNRWPGAACELRV